MIFAKQKMDSNDANNQNSILNMETINQRVKAMEYAVRGAIPIRATQLAKELESGAQKPFDEVIRANIGDCHAMNQKPITFFRFQIFLTSFGNKRQIV